MRGDGVLTHRATDIRPDPLGTRVRDEILQWAGERQHAYPWRQDEVSDWGKLIAELMLQRTTASRVVPIWVDFVARFPSPSDAASRPEEVARIMRPLGLGKRTASVINLARRIEIHGSIPVDREQLLELPGVGVYTADAYLCFARGHCRTLVDSNISRLVHRLQGRVPQKQAHRTRATRVAVEELVGDSPSKELLYALLDFTIDVCRPVPLCAACPLADAELCEHGVSVRADSHTERTQPRRSEE